MQTPVNLPAELLERVQRLHPFPWRQINHPNGLIQVGDRNNVQVDLFLLIEVAVATGNGALAA